MTTLWQDLRYAFRVLIKSPGFTLIAVLTLALGIGANTAIFTVVNGVLLQPLPYPQPQQLVQLHETLTLSGKGLGTASGPDFDDWRAQSRSFSGLAAYFEDGLNLTGSGEPQRLRNMEVSADFFGLLDAQPALGRLFNSSDFNAGARVAVLSNGLWHRVFGADPNIVGKTLELSGEVYTVAGVTSPSFAPVQDEELWTSLTPDNPLVQDRGSHALEVIGRLKLGVSLAAASADMDTIGARLRKQYPDTNAKRGIRTDSLQDLRVRNIRPALLTLLAAVGFVLLIACVNVANLLLARGTTRRKEMALRAALGAGRGRIMRQLLTESVVLAIVGAALGLAFAYSATPALLSIAPANMLQTAGSIHIGSRILLFTAALSLLTGLLFGLVPALHSGRVDLGATLKEAGERSGSAGGMSRFKSFLVAFEIATAMLLLIGGGLMLRSFSSLLHVAPGFDPHNVLTMELYLPSTTVAQVPTRLASIHEMLGHIKALPGVVSASSIVYLPFSGLNINGDFKIQGRPMPKPGDNQVAEWRLVSAGYLTTMHVPILRGRDLSDSDDASGVLVAVVNRAFAEEYFPNQDPIGQSVNLWDGVHPWLRIVGVAGDERQFGPTEPPRPSVYVCMSAMNPSDAAQFLPGLPISLVVRTEAAPANSAKPVVSAIHTVDSQIPVSRTIPFEDLISQSLSQPRLAATLLGVFAALALILAAVGLYGVMAYVVTQRTREIGIRVALGAQQKDVLHLVLGQGAKLVGVGVAAGIVAALGLTRLMSSLLFGVSAADPATFILVAVVLAAVALFACYIPARRAMRTDPMVALRYE
ncbi:MAG TPA: ABC transporter permease [Candidatus Acidoferrales bacterium]|nr:ABC transporter permease [Candidatus Acidoferrales bacterium]